MQTKLRSSTLLGSQLFSKKDAFGGEGTFAAATANLANGMLGAGILAYPFVFANMGLLMGPLLGITIYLICLKSLRVIGIFQLSHQTTTYPEVAATSLTPLHEMLAIAGTVLSLGGSCIAYTTIIGDMLSVLMMNFVAEDSALANPSVIIPLMMLVLIPMCWITDINKLAPLSYVTILAMAYLVMLIISRSLMQLSVHGIATRETPLFVFSEATISGLPVFVFSFGCSPMYPLIFSALYKPTLDKMTWVTVYGLGICLTLYILCGLLGLVSSIEMLPLPQMTHPVTDFCTPLCTPPLSSL
jgi:amino acid permease